jgi:Xaa-Pro aminopeptidase
MKRRAQRLSSRTLIPNPFDIAGRPAQSRTLWPAALIGLVALMTQLALAVRATVAQSSLPSAAPLASITRPGDGRVVCGLGREFHAGRRQALREAVGTGWILLRGLPPPRSYEQFHQDKTFWYFTGISSPNVALLMNAETGEEILFLPPRDEVAERWEGPGWDTEDEFVTELSGCSTVLPITTLVDELRARVTPDTSLHIYRRPWVIQGGAADIASAHLQHQVNDPLDGRPSREDALAERLQELTGVEPHDISRSVAQLRLIKQPEELVAMRRAAQAGAQAMAAAIASTESGLGEWELESLMAQAHIAAGASGPAYHAIVGSGPNSCVLHYSQIDRRMADGEIVLVDYGPEFDMYTTDITRTWPVNGRFTARQAELYDIVREAQQAGIDAAGPGKTIDDVYRAIDQVFAAHEVQSLVRHGPCHLIGLDVHDVGRLEKLRPGMCLTVEPGLYSESENLGIRIEDVIAITDDGVEVLSRGVPVDRRAIEQLMADGVH